MANTSIGEGTIALRARFGFRDGARGTHGSRTILLQDLRQLLHGCPTDASRSDYQHAIVDDNLLGKRTAQTRRITLQKLSELYGLDPALPVFRGLRRLWDGDEPGQPLLALLCAFARDPLLRSSAPVLLAQPDGAAVSPGLFVSFLKDQLEQRMSDQTLLACGQRLASTFTQSGHLRGHAVRRRQRASATPGSVAYALFLGYLEGYRRICFGVLVNYHKLDRKLLETLTYNYLGDWLQRQEHDVGKVDGATERRDAALALQKKLRLILEGEAPYDLFVRWKPLEQQPIGWEPDINDGVRLNIRPFCQAEVLRKNPKIEWGKDRGKDPTDSPWGVERRNDLHLKLAEKQAARRNQK